MNVNDELTLKCTSMVKEIWRGVTLEKDNFPVEPFPRRYGGEPLSNVRWRSHSRILVLWKTWMPRIQIRKWDLYSGILEFQVRSRKTLKNPRCRWSPIMKRATQYSYDAMAGCICGNNPCPRWGRPTWYTRRGITWSVGGACRKRLWIWIYEAGYGTWHLWKMVQAWMVELDQFEEQNLLSLDCNNTRVGSRRLQVYNNRLPGDLIRNTYLQKNMWECSNA